MTVRSFLFAVALAGCAARPHDSTQLASPEASAHAIAPSHEGVANLQPPPPPVLESPCPEGMVIVDGDYCTEVRQDCLVWQDPPSSPFARCARYAPSICMGSRIRKRFCIDRDEYVSPGEVVPSSNVSWSDARQACERNSKRLCLETEWEFACEGEAMLPYPTGYVRDPKACSIDKLDLVDPSTGRLRDKRVAPSELQRCASPFGAVGMTGNVDEWVWRDRTPGEHRSALKGGWWMPARDRCRPATTAHDEHFHELQTGVRCCADAM